MKSGPKVLHLSRTPLVGAPGKIAAALTRHSHFKANAVIARDYPKPLRGLFLSNSMMFAPSGLTNHACRILVREADVIHVHNDLTDELLALVAEEASSRCRFVYQVHSPLREPPLYVDRTADLGFEWSAKLTVPHCSQRFFQNYRVVPNIVLFPPSVPEADESKRIRVLFSPAHRRRGFRWGDKVSDGLNNALTVLRSLDLADVLEASGIPPASLMEIRRTTHISIDEVATGALHQVSLEGLCAGNVVINGADYFTLASLRMSIRASEDPPFVRMEDADIAKQLPELVRDRDRIREVQRRSAEYYEEYLRPERLVSFFVQVYEEVLGAN